MTNNEISITYLPSVSGVLLSQTFRRFFHFLPMQAGMCIVCQSASFDQSACPLLPWIEGFWSFLSRQDFLAHFGLISPSDSFDLVCSRQRHYLVMKRFTWWQSKQIEKFLLFVLFSSFRSLHTSCLGMLLEAVLWHIGSDEQIIMATLDAKGFW